jgi:DNA-binding XRE family transcriptional regulator
VWLAGEVNMDRKKRRKLKASGWRVGSAQDFVELSDEEAAYLEMRIALARVLVKRRKSLGVTQAEVARTLGSSQSRVAKMEAGDPSVSLDLMIRSLLALGATRAQVGRAIGSGVAAGDRLSA